MFTGIIEEVGKISEINHNSITIACKSMQDDLQIGDSICVNGVCLTVIEFNQISISAQISHETKKITTFECLTTSDFVNLERAMQLSSRFGGHIVTGHIDTVGKILNIIKNDIFYEVTVTFDNQFSKYVVKKGSIAINGISLTVADVFNNTIKLAIIPHTFENTSFAVLKNNDNVNIEFDILGKYVEKNLLFKDNSNITIDLLEKNGFI